MAGLVQQVVEASLTHVLLEVYRKWCLYVAREEDVCSVCGEETNPEEG